MICARSTFALLIGLPILALALLGLLWPRKPRTLHEDCGRRDCPACASWRRWFGREP